jgi:hypothetical protein
VRLARAAPPARRVNSVSRGRLATAVSASRRADADRAIAPGVAKGIRAYLAPWTARHAAAAAPRARRVRWAIRATRSGLRTAGPAKGLMRARLAIAAPAAVCSALVVSPAIRGTRTTTAPVPTQTRGAVRAAAVARPESAQAVSSATCSLVEMAAACPTAFAGPVGWTMRIVAAAMRILRGNCALTAGQATSATILRTHSGRPA